MDMNVCIFCKNGDVCKEIIDDGITISCNNCRGKYTINNRKGLFQWNIYLLKCPKWNINPIISGICMLLIIPFGGILTLGDISLANNNFLKVLIILYANFIIITMIITFFQNMYNYIFKDYLIMIASVITKETNETIFYKTLVFINYIIGGIITFAIFIYMNYNVIKYLIL